MLDTDAARDALLERHGSRATTETPKPDAILYRGRHDDREDCWAIYHHTIVEIGPAEALSPHVPEHVEAVTSVAKLWDLPHPPPGANDVRPSRT